MDSERRLRDALHGLINVASRHLDILTTDELKALSEALNALAEVLDHKDKEETDGSRTS